MAPSNDSGRPPTGTWPLGAWRVAALICAVFLIAGARPVRAAIDVWTTHGPEGGEATALAIDPKSPTTLYVQMGDYGGRYGGLFKSTDGGDTWTATGLTTWWVQALAIDPKTPTTLYAAGTVMPSIDSSSIAKSTDGGDTWTITELPGGAVHALTIDPQTPTTLYTGASKSTDGGNTWAAIGNAVAEDGSWGGQAWAVAIDPRTPTTLYVSRDRCWQCDPDYGCCDRGGVYKSTDGGNTWSEVGPWGKTGPSPYVVALVIDPQTPTTLYALTAGNSGGGGGVQEH